jgi:peptidyl-prolyl cis-trans isomerase SurA
VILRTGRSDLAEMARRYSDDPSAPRNAGYLGVFAPGEVDPAVAAAVCSLDVGQIAGPVESPYGFHVIRREPVRRLRLHHVLVAYEGAARADQTHRTRGEARRIARALQRKLAAGEVGPCDVAARFSDDPQNRDHCGDLGWVEPGMLQPAIEQAVFALEPGQCTGVLESDYGFHVFWRD